jgi:hypothetical protein
MSATNGQPHGVQVLQVVALKLCALPNGQQTVIAEFSCDQERRDEEEEEDIKRENNPSKGTEGDGAKGPDSEKASGGEDKDEPSKQKESRKAKRGAAGTRHLLESTVKGLVRLAALAIEINQFQSLLLLPFRQVAPIYGIEPRYVSNCQRQAGFSFS